MGDWADGVFFGNVQVGVGWFRCVGFVGGLCWEKCDALFWRSLIHDLLWVRGFEIGFGFLFSYYGEEMFWLNLDRGENGCLRPCLILVILKNDRLWVRELRLALALSFLIMVKKVFDLIWVSCLVFVDGDFVSSFVCQSLWLLCLVLSKFRTLLTNVLTVFEILMVILLVWLVFVLKWWFC